uniref:Transmembrane protein n=1 Tax=Leersia perrieri TaxID=77586 RepID=A0A0D9W1X4_9ORYZ
MATSSSSTSVSFRARGMVVLIQAMVLICFVIMSSSYTCEARRFLIPFFREEKPPIALHPVSCPFPPPSCPKN